MIDGLDHSSDKLNTAIRGRRYPRYRAVRDDRPCCCISSIDRNYYHRFVDSIPRVFALHHPELLAKPLVRLYIGSHFTADERSLLAFLLPENVEVDESKELRRVEAREYMHLPLFSGRRTDTSPEWQVESGGYLPAAYLAWYRTRVADYFGFDSAAAPRRRVYVSRAGAKVRRLLNEPDVKSLLSGLGFEIVRLESLSLQAQIELFRECSIVVAQHGAGLTNILYMPPDGRVIELMSSPHMVKHYSYLATDLGLEHTFVCSDGKTKNDDMTVDLKRLTTIVLTALTRLRP